MGGIFTQSRELGGPSQPVFRLIGNETPMLTATVSDVHNQTTTSYRSGRGFDLSDDPLGPVDARVMQPSKLVLAGSYDTGHPFSTFTRRRVLFNRSDSSYGEQVEFSDGFKEMRVTGPMSIKLANHPEWDSYFIPTPDMTSNEIKLWGSRAVSATLPTKPKANVSQFLGELVSDGALPFIPGVHSFNADLNRLRTSGNEFINWEFAVQPFISDLKKIIGSLKTITSSLLQFQADSGRLVRRRFAFPAEITNSISTFSPARGFESIRGYGDLLTGYNAAGNTATIADRVAKNYSFSGAYTYHCEIGDEPTQKLREFEQRANLLFGTRVTPSTLWELAPWSWLIDWKANVGTALSNASAFQDDGLVMKYGYLMRHTVSDRVISIPAYRVRKPYGGPPVLTVTNSFHSERKERVKATPYGFGLDPSGFSAEKWAILAALGFTRSPRATF